MMRRWIIPLLAAVFLAGCTASPSQFLGNSTGQSSATSGLALTFEQLESYALDSEDVTLRLIAENLGQSTAEDISVDLFGASWISGKASLEPLDGVDRAAGQSGEETVHRFTLSPPSVEPGTEKTFDATAQVTYRYETRGTLQLGLDPRAYVPSKDEASVQTSMAPVQLSTSLKTPISTKSGSSHPIQVTIENRADGKITSAVDLTGELTSPPSGVSLSGCDKTVSISKSATVTCSLTTPSSGVSFETTVPLRLTASYDYRQEAETPVTVRGVG